MSRIKVVLDQSEYTALFEMARTELRSPDEQLRYLLRQELSRRGLLKGAIVSDAPTTSRTLEAGATPGG